MKKLVSLMLTVLIAVNMSLFVYADNSIINVEFPTFTSANVETDEEPIADLPANSEVDSAENPSTALPETTESQEEPKKNKDIVDPEFMLDGSTLDLDSTIDISDEASFEQNDDIEIETIEDGISSRAENQPPVAGLQYVILNPESLKNGQITTATQIAWLWSYNGQNFTYDPDGDAITNINIGGIPSSAIIGSITGNIGFATQFSTPGQYQMTYQVTDARGAKSNILKIVINVESSGTNNRPVCQIIYAPTDGIVRTGHPLVISWANSYDNDAGDSINDVRGLVYKDGSENSEDISKYINKLETDKCVVIFNLSGSYEIWMSVSDKSGAWSDWAIFTITVKSGQIVFSDVKINTFHDEGGLAEEDTKYIDYYKSNELAKEVYTPEKIVELCSLDYYPAGLPNDQLGTNIEISGKVKYSDGTVAPNIDLNITMPMSKGPGLFVELKSDVNGNFSYSLPSNKYWETIGLMSSTVGFPFSGDFYGKTTQYAHYSNYGVLFYYPTDLTIATTINNYQISRRIAATAGIARVPLIGGTYFYMDNLWNYIDPPLYTRNP